MRARYAALIFAIAAGAAACDKDTPVDPLDVAAAAAGAGDTTRSGGTGGTGGRSDTTRTDTGTVRPPATPPARPPVTPPDTMRPVTGTSHVSGRVLGGTYNPSGPDTLRFEPVAGSVVKLFHNRMVNGASASVFIAEVTVGADGAYAFGPIPAGYYLLRVFPPAGSGWSESLSYLPATTERVSMNLYVWKRPPSSTPPADSTRP